VKNRLGVLALVLALAACGHHANVTTQSAGSNQSASSAGGTTLVNAGTDFYGKLQQPISTKSSHDGDTFVLVQTNALFHKDPALAGSSIDGHLENVRSAGPMRSPGLTLVFDDIRMADGSKGPVDVKLESMKAFEPKTHHLRTIGMMIGGAVAGHEVSKHTGKQHGALIGALGGYTVSQTLKTDIVVPAGTVIEVRFQRPATSAGTGS
jgi:hypothetical protein